MLPMQMRCRRVGEPRLRKFSRARRATTYAALPANIAIRRGIATFACCRLPANGFRWQLCKISETERFGSLSRRQSPLLASSTVCGVATRHTVKAIKKVNEQSNCHDTASIGMRIRKPEKGQRAPAHRASHQILLIFVILYTCSSLQMALLIMATVQSRPLAGCCSLDHWHHFSVSSAWAFWRCLEYGANRSHHAGVHQSAAGAALFIEDAR